MFFSIKRQALLRIVGSLVLSSWVVTSPAAVFVNEIHYDDSTAAGDVNEVIEIVATAGEDLTTYSVVLYNGSAPAAATTYDTDAVPAGSIQNCVNGGSAKIASIAYPTNGVQNGSNDAIALVQGATVIQFLSYEGVATASNGPAAGMTSADIGVSELSSTAPGTSLQLGGGPSSTYAGFTWNASATATPGACNNGQSFAAAVDNPPTLSSSNPADTATGVALNANIVLTFSENVTVPATNSQWFSLICQASATDYTAAAVVTGSGTNTITINPATDFIELEVCTLNIVGAQVSDMDGTIHTLASDPRIGFTIAEDLAPSVSTIIPPFSSNPVTPLNANIDLTFSEPVTTTGAWFTVVCPTSGTRDINNSVVTGTGNTRTINPNVNYANDEICTVNLFANLIEDLDGTADKLDDGSNYESQFRTVLDVAPSVTGTTPLDGASNVGTASNVSVTFSEAVNAAVNSFTLNCGAGNLPFALSNTAQTIYTLNPNADLPAITLCTVTVVAANVLDLDGTATPMQSNYVFTFTTGASASNYYASVDTSSCSALRTSLHNLIDDHTPFPYTAGTTDTWDILDLADQDPLDSARVLDVYKNASYAKAGGGNTFYNREHTWPNSYGFNDILTYGDGSPYSPYVDTHMLMVSDITYNSNRGSKPYGYCNPATDATCTSIDATLLYNGQGGGATTYASGNHNFYKTTGGGENLNRYDVWGFRRGDVARAMMYMDVRYEGGLQNGNAARPEPDLILTNTPADIQGTASGVQQATGHMGLKTDIVAWHRGDLPTSAEVLRNDVIQSFQGNRNPFVDHPEWACLFDTPCSCVGGPNTAPSITGPSNQTINEDSSTGVLNVTLNDAETPLGSLVLTASSNNTSIIPNANIALGGAAGARTVTVTPASNQNGGPVTITLTVTDGGNLTAQATFTVTVTAVDDAPVAVTDAPAAILEDALAQTFDVLANDTDADGGSKTVIAVGAVTPAAAGTAAMGGGGANVTFTPASNFCGNGVSFNYTINGGSSAAVSFNINCVNDAPQTVGTLPNVNVGELNSVNIATAGGFSDVDNATLTYAISSTPALPAGITFNTGSGILSGTAPLGSSGTYAITVTASDAQPLSAQQSFNLIISADAIFNNGFE